MAFVDKISDPSIISSSQLYSIPLLFYLLKGKEEFHLIGFEYTQAFCNNPEAVQNTSTHTALCVTSWKKGQGKKKWQ